jgi:4'-phosphopantetheinyl transferase
MVKVYYSYIDHSSLNNNHSNIRDLLPKEIGMISDRYYYNADRTRFLCGKWLISYALSKEGYSMDELKNLKLDSYKRPYLCDEIDFNISHSGNYVVCVISKNSRVGVDVEEVKDVDFNDFEFALSIKDREVIDNSENGFTEFFKIWTKKEAIAKANGKGLGLPLSEMNIYTKLVDCEGELWNTSYIDIEDTHPICIAFQGDKEIIIKKIIPNLD